MRGQATPTTPAKSVGLNVFHGVRAPVWTSRRETGHEVSPRRPISNVFPSLVQRKGVSPDCEPCIGCGSPPFIGTKAIPSLVTAATRLPSGEREWACVPKLKPSGVMGRGCPPSRSMTYTRGACPGESFPKVPRCRTTYLRRSPRAWSLEIHRSERYASANYSPDRIGLSFSISSCTAKDRQSHAQCARPGSMVSTASRITSRKVLILRSSPQRIYQLCEAMLAREGGADCVF